ncbi:hypothetical protein B0H14DRAFT_2581932 [Mycena olivaceomarginata]|nr:hypothetical protein B0H14DRAFT_2581932 [Mycena olivaceomarginata]
MSGRIYCIQTRLGFNQSQRSANAASKGMYSFPFHRFTTPRRIQRLYPQDSHATEAADAARNPLGTARHSRLPSPTPQLTRVDPAGGVGDEHGLDDGASEGDDEGGLTASTKGSKTGAATDATNIRASSQYKIRTAYSHAQSPDIRLDQTRCPW